MKKISNSKKQLAKIISENGGWREGAEFAAQDKKSYSLPNMFWFYTDKPNRFESASSWRGQSVGDGVEASGLIKNWHQTILSSDEYFHLYPAPDADGWIEYNGSGSPYSNEVVVEAKWSDGDFTCSDNFGPGCAWIVKDGEPNITHHRLHKPEQALGELCGKAAEENRHEQVLTNPPSIEQLAADYRNAKDYAESLQEEANNAWTVAEMAKGELIDAGKAIGLLVSLITAKQEPELVITVQDGD